MFATEVPRLSIALAGNCSLRINAHPADWIDLKFLLRRISRLIVENRERKRRRIVLLIRHV